MSAPAYLPLFGSDYLADTQHLSTEQHGAYLLLMIAAWRQDDGGLPLDDKKLARISGLSTRKWLAIKDTILDFWFVEDGRIFQQRLLKERRFAAQKSDSNRKNAGKRWDAQRAENIEGDLCDRISERNAPQPQPQSIEEPKGSPIQMQPKPKSPTVKSVRMSADWQPEPLPPTVEALACLWPQERLARELEQFRDYWLDRTTKRPGWDRTWHNRIRDIHDRVMRDNRNGNQYPARDNRDGVAKALDRRLGLDGPPGEAGRFDAGDGGGDSVIPIARARLL